MKNLHLLFTPLFVFTISAVLLTSVSSIFTVVYADPSFGSSTNVPSSYINIGQPRGMALTAEQDIWYVDAMNSRLVKYDPSTGEILRTVGRLGEDEGEFEWQIIDVAIDDVGDIYVLSFNNHVYKLDSNGGFMARYDVGASVSEPRGITYDAYTDSLLITSYQGNNVVKFDKNLVSGTSFGTAGSGNGQFNQPFGVVTDSNGRIYVADSANDRVQVFNSSYEYLFQIKNWTNENDELDGFIAVTDVVILSNGTITVANQNHQTIEQFDSAGNFIRRFGFDGSAPENIREGEFILRDSSNNIYVADGVKNAIKRYNSTGGYQDSIINNENVAGKLYYPADVLFEGNGDGSMLVLDGGGSSPRIQKFTNSGTFVSTLLDQADLGNSAYHMSFGRDGKLFVANDQYINIFTKSGQDWVNTGTVGTGGSGDGQFKDVRDMAFDDDGYLYVADFGNSRVQKFLKDPENNDGNHFIYVSQFGTGWHDGDSQDPTPGQLKFPTGIVINSNGHIIVSDTANISEFTSDGTYVGYVGSGLQQPINLTIVDNTLYASDSWGYAIHMYDEFTFEELGSFSGHGSGQMQFYEPGCIVENPLTNDFILCDMSNGRLQSTALGYRIINLIESADVVIRTHEFGETDEFDAYVGQSLSSQAWDPNDFNLAAVPARLLFGPYVVADFTVDLTQDRDWSEVNVLTLPANSKALLVNLNQSTAPGISTTHSLYVYRYTNQTNVTVCPDAASLADVSVDCISNDSGFILSPEEPIHEGDGFTAVLTVVNNLLGVNYWKIDGLIGTGAFSSLFETSFILGDQMTRQKISVASNHNITFGTSYNLTHNGDTIEVVFDPAFDLSILQISDVQLFRAGDQLTVDTNPGVDTWGLVIDNVNHRLLFTAPTNSGSAQYINLGNIIQVKILNDKLLNPAIVNSYLIFLTMTSSDGGVGQNIETGNISIPIVDSDQVNITAFVNSFISFDIDTALTDTDCAYNVCLTHENGSAGSNYTVDLGELNSTWVNKSNDAAVQHVQGGSGVINSIWFDLTTNAYGGAILYVTSANSGLQGPAANLIASVVNDGDAITTNSGLYGFQLPVAGSGNGTIDRGSDCVLGDAYCALTVTPNIVFDTDGAPLDTGRLRMDIAAAANYINNPGSYTDTLTFIAVPTY